MIQYDPSLLLSTPVRSAPLSPPPPLTAGDPLHLVGLSKDQRLVSRRTAVRDVRELLLTECKPPRFRPVNVEVVELDDPLECDGGVLCDESGQLRGLWVSYAYQDAAGNDHQAAMGMQLDVVMPVLNSLLAGKTPKLRTLGVEMWTASVADARAMGLTATWMERMEEADPGRRQAVVVRRVADDVRGRSREEEDKEKEKKEDKVDKKEEKKEEKKEIVSRDNGVEKSESRDLECLREGDLILMAEGKVVTSFRDLDVELDRETVKMVRLAGKESVMTCTYHVAVDDSQKWE